MPSALVPIDQAHNRSRDFGRFFCATLTHFKDPDGHGWGDCARYLAVVDMPLAQAPSFVSPYRFAFVAGFGGDCLNDVRAFSTSIAHLREAHQIEVEDYRVLPFGSSRDNGKAIAQRLDNAWKVDATHRYVLIGYSKGAVDLLEAMSSLDAPRTKIAALVTIAGIVGGTSEADTFRALMDPSRPWVDRSCPSDMVAGLQSLRPDIRRQFLQSQTVPVPAYSLVGATSAENTSKALRSSWTRLSRYAAEEDGLLVAWEGVLPGATFLGIAHADHWAIALPFEQASQRFKAIDHNRFPRDALFEAIVRFVSANIPAPAAPPK